MSNVSGPSGQGHVAMHGTVSITMRNEMKLLDVKADAAFMQKLDAAAMKAYDATPSSNTSAPATTPGAFGNFLNNVDATFEAKMKQMGDIGAKFDAMESEILNLSTSSKPGDAQKAQMLSNKLKAMQEAVSGLIKSQGEAVNTMIRNSRQS